MSKLAALAGRRQRQAVLRSGRAADAADRAARRLWLQVLALLARRPGPAEGFRAALDLFRRLRPVLVTAVAGELRGTAAWARVGAGRDLTRAVPRDLLARAAAGKLAIGTLPYPLQLSAGRGRATAPPLGFLPLREDEGVARLAFADPLAPFRIADWTPADLTALLFPPPTEQEIAATVYASGWQGRLASTTRLAAPESLAQALALGLAAGKSQQEIARDLLPLVEQVRASARRVARTESLRVAQAGRMQAHEALGDLVAGYTVHATLDKNTRAWHRARDGATYWARPAPGQKGYAQRPDPPDEPPDPGERPPGTPATAFNCRCYLVPVLRDL